MQPSVSYYCFADVAPLFLTKFFTIFNLLKIDIGSEFGLFLAQEIKSDVTSP
jgi:hypothetical protein